MPTTQKRPSRPTTPLRRVERGSLSALSNSRGGGTNDDAIGTPGGATSTDVFPLAALDMAFADLADSFADFQSNMQQICDLGDEVGRFDESFASFLYGLNVNAFCVDFPEAPVAESYRRVAALEKGQAERKDRQEAMRWETLGGGGQGTNGGSDATYLTTDDSFVERPLPPSQSQPLGSSTNAKTGSKLNRSNGTGAGTGASNRGARGGTASTRGARGTSRGGRAVSGTAGVRTR